MKNHNIIKRMRMKKINLEQIGLRIAIAILFGIILYLFITGRAFK